MIVTPSLSLQDQRGRFEGNTGSRDDLRGFRRGTRLAAGQGPYLGRRGGSRR